MPKGVGTPLTPPLAPKEMMAPSIVSMAREPSGPGVSSVGVPVPSSHTEWLTSSSFTSNPKLIYKRKGKSQNREEVYYHSAVLAQFTLKIQIRVVTISILLTLQLRFQVYNLLDQESKKIFCLLIFKTILTLSYDNVFKTPSYDGGGGGGGGERVDLNFKG